MNSRGIPTWYYLILPKFIQFCKYRWKCSLINCAPCLLSSPANESKMLSLIGASNIYQSNTRIQIRITAPTLAQAGIDISIFTPHYTTRHAATSAALRKGVSLNTIQQTAGWSKKSEIFSKILQSSCLQIRLLCSSNLDNLILTFHIPWVVQ